MKEWIESMYIELKKPYIEIQNEYLHDIKQIYTVQYRFTKESPSKLIASKFNLVLPSI